MAAGIEDQVEEDCKAAAEAAAEIRHTEKRDVEESKVMVAEEFHKLTRNAWTFDFGFAGMTVERFHELSAPTIGLGFAGMAADEFHRLSSPTVDLGFAGMTAEAVAVEVLVSTEMDIVEMTASQAVGLENWQAAGLPLTLLNVLVVRVVLYAIIIQVDLNTILGIVQ